MDYFPRSHPSWVLWPSRLTNRQEVPEPRSAIAVLAGVNGAGKSSIAGAALRANGGEYFKPDEAPRLYRDTRQEVSQEQANSWAWRMGKERLEVAIAEKLAFNFEATLGGNTISDFLMKAATGGTPVRVFFVGLDSPTRLRRWRCGRICRRGA